jgi:hypothetical protein
MREREPLREPLRDLMTCRPQDCQPGIPPETLEEHEVRLFPAHPRLTSLLLPSLPQLNIRRTGVRHGQDQRNPTPRAP